MWYKVKEQLIGWTIILTFLAIVGGCGYYESHYTRKGCVEVSVEEQVVYVQGKGGHLWSYEVEGEAPAVGTLVDLHMDTLHTDWYFEDDVITRVSTHQR